MSNCMAAAEEKSSYSYSDVASSSGGNQTLHHSHMVSQLHNFDPNPEIYNLTAGMEMIGFPTKNLQPQGTTESTSLLWKGFFNNPLHTATAAADGSGPSSSSKEMNEPTASSCDHHFYQQDANEALMMVSQDSSSSAPWSTHHHHHHHHHPSRLLVDDPSLRCVFPREENGRPSQGLSLSLNSSNPSSIGLQTFEMRQPDDLRFGPSSSRSVNIPHHSQLIQDHSFVRNSKYLGPAQELLNEFCNIGTKQAGGYNSSKHKVLKTSDCQDENVIKKQSLYSMDFLELQIRKTKLLHMLEEVDRRYKHYCDQMKAVVSSFEAVAGNGAASVYSALASKAMSGHFRCLKDGIVAQIKATKKAMGEKDAAAAPGTMRGETPRLKLIDQTLRQQRALQQMSMMESHPWRPQRGLPERSVSILRAWLFEHFLHPYPSDVDKHILARQTGLSRSQVSNWFINARVRLWKPMVEEMYLEEVKDGEGTGGALDSSNLAAENDAVQNPSFINDDQKPSHDQLIRIDSDCLSSIITNSEDASRKDKFKSIIQNDPHDKNPNFGRLGDSSSIGMELDFSSYNHHSSTAAYGGSGSVSLTLGLHQHGPSGGLTLGFSPAAQNHSSLFYPRDHMEAECQTVQYSLLDSEGQNLQPYRNLMGAQLLHDLAG